MYCSEPMLSSKVIDLSNNFKHFNESNHLYRGLDDSNGCSRPDPRIQIELENLNTSTDLINKLELELNDYRNNFRVLLSDSSQKIAELTKKLGSCVERARPYYESRIRAKELQSETQKAALKFERASSSHMAAKEMVRLAEEGLQNEGNIFDSSWQEVLNHSTIRVNECERERVLQQLEHQRTSHAYNNCEQLVTQLHKQLKRSIVKARPYFEMKAQFNQMLDEQMSKINLYQQRVSKAKLNYSKALQRLEEISDEIHHKRKYNESMPESRGVGVGAESPVPSSPKLTKVLRKLSLESSDTLSQMISTMNWFSKSDNNSERDDCESIADSIAESTDTLDETVIENLMLAKNLNDFDSILDSENTTVL